MSLNPKRRPTAKGILDYLNGKCRFYRQQNAKECDVGQMVKKNAAAGVQNNAAAGVQNNAADRHTNSKWRKKKKN